VKPSDDDLVVYYKFDESRAITAADSSGNGYTGTPMNSPVVVTGVSGNALHFASAETSYVTRATAGTDFDNITTEFTVSAWFCPGITRFINQDNVYFGGMERTGCWILGWAGTVNGWVLTVYEQSTGLPHAVAFVPRSWLFYGKWIHLIGTYKKDSFARIYIDGNLVDENTTDVSYTVKSGNDAAFNVGIANTTTYWDGSIDEVRVYSKAITTTDEAIWLSKVESDWPLTWERKFANIDTRHLNLIESKIYGKKPVIYIRAKLYDWYEQASLYHTEASAIAGGAGDNLFKLRTILSGGIGDPNKLIDGNRAASAVYFA